MIRALFQAGYRLSGGRDARLTQGLRLAALEGALAAVPYPFLYLLLMDVLSGRIELQRTLLFSVGMLACLLARMLVGARSMPLIFTGAYAMMGEARLHVADRLRHLPMGWFSRIRSGDLGARLTSDLELVENLWSHFLGVFVAGLSMPLFLLVFLGWLDWRLCLVVLLTLPLSVLALAWNQRLMRREVPRLSAASAHAQSEILDYVQGIAVIRSFGRFGAAWQRLQAAVNAQHAAAVAIETRPAPWTAAFGFVLETGFVLVVLIGVEWLRVGRLTPQTLIAFAVLALPIHRQVFDLGISTLLLRFAQRAMARIEVILEEPAMAEPPVPRVPEAHDIVLDHVGFGYEGGSADAAQVLHDICCVIPAKGLIAVVGPSGAGKSTLLNLMARLWDVQQGAIRIGGVDLREMGSDVLHRHVAMVFQDVVLFSGTVLHNIRIGRPDATREQVVDAARRAQAHVFIERLPQGYDTVIDEGGASLSGGERQRISIARALLKDAPILLLDEATSSLDPSAEAEIQRALSELVRERTVVVIAHRLRSVRHADRIFVLDKGRLVEQGAHDELLLHPGVYARLWQQQELTLDWRLAEN